MGKQKNGRNRQNEDNSDDSTESCEAANTNNDVGKNQKEKCPHTDKGCHFHKLRNALKKKNATVPECATCRKSDENSNNVEDEESPSDASLWMCLKCGSVNCGDDHKGHAAVHSEIPRSDFHSLAMDINSQKVWCFDCKDEIFPDKDKFLNDKVIRPFFNSSNTTTIKTTKKDPPSCQKAVAKIVEDKPKAHFPAVSGLFNLGNTCFFNAVMQCLARTPFLVKVLDDLRTMDIKFVLPGGKCKISNNPDGEEEEEVDLPPIEGNLEKLGSNTITSVLCQTLMDMQTSGTTIRPSELLNAIRKKTVQCMDGGQHDSHELLRHLLELVRNEDLRRYRSIILEKYGIKSSPPKNKEKQFKAKVKFYDYQASSRLLGTERVFQGILVSTLECLECHNSSSRTEPFLDLSLPVMIAKKESNSFDDDGESIIANGTCSAPVTMSRKKQATLAKKELKARKKAAKKKNAAVKRFSSHNDDFTPYENSISEEKPNSAADSEVSDADVEDNIEAEGASAQEVGESGYSSEKASAVASPVPLGELPVSSASNEINGLPINDDSCQPSTDLRMMQLSNVDDNALGYSLSTPSPIDVSMTELNQIKVTSAFAQIENDNENALGIYLQNSLTINCDLTSPEGQTISPVSSPITSKDSPTSPISSASVGEESDTPMFHKLFKETHPDFRKNNTIGDEFAVDAQNEDDKSLKTEYKYDTNDEELNNRNANGITSNSPKRNQINSLPRKSGYATKEGECSVQSCLNQFTALELMTGNNKVGCDACTERENKGKEGKKVCTQSTKQYLIEQVPPVLILHLKRFQMQRRGFNKLTKHISFPTLLDLSPVCKGQTEQKLYALYGVVEHQGTYSGGHYVSYVKSRAPLESDDPRWSFVKKISATDTDETSVECNSLSKESPMIEKSPTSAEPPPGRWYLVSDSRVSEVSESTVLQSQAYLLFYERIL